MRSILFLIISFFVFSKTHAQDFLLQGWYWNYPKTTQQASWADTLINKAHELSQAGFTQVWLPPLSFAAAGPISNGYDIKDYYYLGVDNSVKTGFGTRTKVNAVINKFNQEGLVAVADMIYNHRDGGSAEDNPAVEGWIENYDYQKRVNGDNPYPSDRFRCVINIGGSTGLGAGKYYFKMRSASQHPDFFGKPYSFFVKTNRTFSSGLPAKTESAVNGGANCGEPHDTVALAQTMNVTIDGAGCGIDEFEINIDTAQFFAAGDQITITMVNQNSDYADQYIYGLWYTGTNSDIKDSIIYRTFTKWDNNLLSQRGKMNYTFFKPNGNPTCLCGDSDAMLFYYDIDQLKTEVQDTLFAWTRWMYDSIGTHGFRADAVKNMPPSFVSGLLNNLNLNGMNPPMFVGEFYDYNAGLLKNYVDDVKSGMSVSALNNINPRVFDFSLQGALRDACDQPGFDARNIFQSGMVDGAGASGYDAVTFVNNHDFRTSSQSVDADPILAYSYILTNNKIGLPSVYYSDYYSSIQPQMNELMDAHKKFIFGSSNHEYLNRFSTPFNGNFLQGASSNSLIYQMSGGSGCNGNNAVVVAINFSGTPLRVDQTINTSAQFNVSANDTLIDILGNSNFDYTIVNGANQIYIELPPRSYSVWAKVSSPPAVNIMAASATQLCNGDTLILNSNVTDACFTYRWRKNGIVMQQFGQPTLAVSESGVYTLELSYNGNMPVLSNAISVNVIPQTPVISQSNDTLSSTSAGSFQWYYSSDNITFNTVSGATNNTFIAPTGGYYYVVVTDSTCNANSEVLHVLLTGIQNQSGKEYFELIPNPVHNMLSVETVSAGEFQIINPLGELVLKQTLNGTNKSVNVSMLQSGIYLATFKTNSYLITKTLIIQ